ncbi:hypothetical protein LTR05_002042 [Lithohypha guttulata]|uniref:Uncharacterized protein n=1 Tax=Lithohypha guttulata TaxID=1690604 RepID=A0AAN7T2X5_9EURO|nr:hypothetical protein LTR05_002042 [Lithohypha guttulata]
MSNQAKDHEPRDNDSIRESHLEDTVQRNLATTDSNTTAQGLATSTTPVDTAKAVQSEITIDEHGFVAYFGTTSRFHHEPAENNAANTATFDVGFHRKWLTSNSRFQTAGEKVAYDNLAKDPNLDPTVAVILLIDIDLRNRRS